MAKVHARAIGAAGAKLVAVFYVVETLAPRAQLCRV
jgi:hypothetical protein